MLPLWRSKNSAQRALYVVGYGDACGDYTSILAREEDATGVAQEIGRFLVEHAADRERGWDTIGIDGVVEGDEPMALLCAALKDAGAALHAESRMHTWAKPAKSSLEEHLKDFGKTQRRKIRRWSERIEHHEDLEAEVAGTVEQVSEFLDAMIDLHQRRWTEAGERGSFAEPEFREFVRDAAIDFFRRGQLYLPILRFNGRIIGGELHLIGGNRYLHCYSSGFDLDAAELEPGRILNSRTLVHLYEAGLAGIDYLRGDEPYKERMKATPKRLFHVRAVAPAWLPKLRHAAWWTSFELKQWMRRRAGRQPIFVADLAS